MSLNIVFMGTPEFAVGSLQSTYDWCASEGHRLVGVYTQPDRPVGRGLELRASPVKQRAMHLGLPVFQPEKLREPAAFEQFKSLQADLVVVVAFGQILRDELLALPQFGSINIHSSLLPRWRGAAPIQWAILAGDAESGVSIQRVVRELDAGPVLKQVVTPLSSQETAGTLHDRLAVMGAQVLPEVLSSLVNGTALASEQELSKVTHASKLTKEMESLAVRDRTAVELDRWIRALNPWPGTSVRVGGVRLKIKRALLQIKITGHAGEIFERAGMLLLGTADGALQLEVMQWDGKREITAAEFLNGLKGQGRSLPLVID